MARAEKLSISPKRKVEDVKNLYATEDEDSYAPTFALVLGTAALAAGVAYSFVKMRQKS